MRLSRALVFVAVAVAFADSSIVVLAVPEIVAELDVGVIGASWVITAYNLAVVVAGAVLLPFAGRLDPTRTAAVGLAAFAGASAGCALAPEFAVLVAFRALQGAAAALVLVAALPLLGGRDGVRAWTLAATLGFAAGPALGGLLTELFEWRAIFVAQAPLVALGLPALRALRPAAAREPGAAGDATGRRAWAAEGTLALLTAALVGALFLVVVLLINGFGWSPLPAALAGTTLPLLAAVAEPAGRRLPARTAATAGGLLVAAGLTTLGLMPGARPVLVIAGLALCGAGLGVAAQPLGDLALAGPRPSFDAARTVVARHAGLVLALVVVTPVLVSALEDLERDAEAVGGEVVLRSDLPLTEKVPVMVDLAEAADRADTGLPDVQAVLEPRETGDGTIAALAERLDQDLRDLVAGAFRTPFLLCAAFGLLAAVLALGLGRDAAAVPARRGAVAFLAVAFTGAGAALAADVVLAAPDLREQADPCRAPPAFPGDSVDDTTQRVALAALATAACDLGTSRTGLLRALAQEDPLPWPDDRLEDALRSGITAAIDAEAEQDRIEPATETFLRTVAAAAPIGWITDALRRIAGRG